MPNQLTVEDYRRVQLATRHESYTHRRWPLAVLRAIAGAEIINAAAPAQRRPAPNGLAPRLRQIRSRLRRARS